MGAVDHLHAGVAVVRAAESAPLFGVWVEPVGLLSAALRGGNQQSKLNRRRCAAFCVTSTDVAEPRRASGRISMPTTNPSVVGG